MATPLSQHAQLEAIARRAMLERHLEPDYPAAAKAQLATITSPAKPDGSLRDLTKLQWCSIDNDDSRDLDQLSVGEALPAGETKLLVAVADVDAVIGKGTPIDAHAAVNTTSVYTAGGIFAMLPEKLSTDLTSLNQDQVRVAMLMEFTVAADGSVKNESVYRATVKNVSKLAYDSTAAWLDGKGPLPPPANVPGMDAQLRLQDAAAQRLKARRHAQGALEFETLAPRAVMSDGRVVDLTEDRRNRAHDLIEELMVAANGVTARFLKAKQIPSMRRAVKTPEHWDRIVTYAKKYGAALPSKPDSAALEQFLAARLKADPVRFPDVSLDVVKMMGRGEYVVELPGQTPIGHFGLAVRDYTHSTAPNRRFPDLITHRLLKRALGEKTVAYDANELQALASHCTEKEDDADKVERQVRKSSAAALFIEKRINERFDAVVSGKTEKGAWVRLLAPPIEGKLVHGAEGAEIGERLRVKLIGVDVDKGFIDFAKVA